MGFQLVKDDVLYVFVNAGGGGYEKNAYLQYKLIIMHYMSNTEVINVEEGLQSILYISSAHNKARLPNINLVQISHI